MSTATGNASLAINGTGTSASSPGGWSIWQRLLWKEFSELLPIWITLLAGAIVCAGLLALQNTGNTAWQGPAIFSCLKAFVLLASVATGVLLFAPERERGTVHLLRSLPLRPHRIVWAKLIAGLLGIMAILLLLTLVLRFGLPVRVRTGGPVSLLLGDAWRNQIVVLATPVAIFLLAALAAMRTGSTFAGFMVTGAIAIVAAFAVGYLSLESVTSIDASISQALVATALFILFFWAAIASADAWLEERSWRDNRSARTIDAFGEAGLAPADMRKIESVSAGRAFWSLLWQSERISRKPVGIYLTLMLLLLAGYFAMWLYDGLSLSGRWLEMYFFSSVAISVLATSCLGATVFWHDQQHHRYRFFQQHAERPGLFWLARLLPWSIALLITTLFALMIGGILLLKSVTNDAVRPSYLSEVLSSSSLFCATVLLPVFAFGQWWSMQVRNPIIAIVLAIMSAGLVCWVAHWLAVMGEPLLLFMLPTVSALLASTWHQSHAWLADSTRWRAHAITFGTFSVTMVASFVTFAAHRAYEHPALNLDLDNIATHLTSDEDSWYSAVTQLQFGTPAERQRTAEMYRQASDQIREMQSHYSAWEVIRAWRHLKGQSMNQQPTADDASAGELYNKMKSWVEQNQEPLDLILAASEREACDPILSDFETEKPYLQINRLRSLTLAHCLLLLDQNRPEEALRGIFAYQRVCWRTNIQREPELSVSRMDTETDLFYELLIRWAQQQNQSADAIRDVIKRLELTYVDEAPAILEFGPANNAAQRQWIEEGTAAKSIWKRFQQWGGEGEWLGLIHRFRQIDAELANLVSHTDNGHRSAGLEWLPWERERYRRLLKMYSMDFFQGSLPFFVRNNQQLGQPSRWDADDWFAASPDQRFFDLPIDAGQEFILARDLAQRESIRRYTLLRLALAAYRIENGKLPAQIHELAGYFNVGMPRTVHHSAEFAWLPEGLPVTGFWGDGRESQRVPANLPLLLPIGLLQPIDTSRLEVITPADRDGVKITGIRLPVIYEDWFLMRDVFFDPVVPK